MRFEHWPVRLNAVIGKHRRAPHVWGRSDCIMFAAECVWALTQKFPGEKHFGTYDDETGALRIIAEYGGLEAMIEAALTEAGVEFERIDPAFAQRGDPCLMDDGKSVGICMGAEVLGKTLDGVESRPLTNARICWAIR